MQFTRRSRCQTGKKHARVSPGPFARNAAFQCCKAYYQCAREKRVAVIRKDALARVRGKMLPPSDRPAGVVPGNAAFGRVVSRCYLFCGIIRAPERAEIGLELVHEVV
jgi:hypothetical protein